MSAGRTTPDGFTLIELLVVVAILTAVTFLALDSVSVDMRQQRYDDTRLRLETIRRAILGSGLENGNAPLLYGFIADNGRLPEKLSALTSLPDGWQAQAVLPPPALYSIITNCIGSGTSISVPITLPSLVKGHRGSYLSGTFNGEYRDGWGNIAPSGDTDNFGWAFVTNPTTNPIQLSIQSRGADNATGGTGWDADVPATPLPISEDDWSTPPSGWSINIDNRSTSSATFSATLLTYINDGNPGSWRQYQFQTSSCSPGTSCPLTFNTSSCNQRIPLGRHLLVLFKDSNTYIGSRTIDLFAGAQPPNVTLEIR